MKSKKDTHEKSITEVTSVISHQLKTPLSAIKSSLEVLSSGDLGGLTVDQKDYLILALKNVERMIRLVKSLLDASRIEEGRFELHKEQASVALIVQGVVEGLSSLAKAKNSEIVTAIEENLPEIQMDIIKIQEVINNLIFNALRYSKGKGTVTVKVKKQKNAIVFSISDTGIGIPKNDKEKIFSKYYRSPRVSALAPDGSGLGLFISRAIIEEHNGKIWFESEENKGSTFFFSLPIQ